ncbi:Dabb family protein [Paraburkholderia acidicola]|uniref:Dabb family protein n=1 Tax=Paraburkholderia acidicola TaxID=1912599 RepID=UPI000BBCD97F|nr:Dabb family protein [Paraburkholderia acidicola]
MIRHIVMWQVRGETAQEKRLSCERVRAGFEGLRGRIPGMRHLEIGIDSSAVDYACDVVLVSDFESREALDAYANHPEHLRVRQQLGDTRTARHQVDYEVGQQSASSPSSASPAAEATDANA